MNSSASVGELTRRLDGCVMRNHAQDVLDVMDVLEIDFMPVVENLGGRKILGVITRWELARVLDQFGTTARVSHGSAALLPTVEEGTPLDRLVAVAGEATAYVVVDDDGGLRGIYRPAGAEASG